MSDLRVRQLGWAHTEETAAQEARQVEAILTDLERRLSAVVRDLGDVRNMWARPARIEESDTAARRSPAGTPAVTAAEVKLQGNFSKDLAEVNSEPTATKPLKTSRTKRKLMQLQTKGMSAEQLRSYHRERLFLHTVAAGGASAHACANEGLLNGFCRAGTESGRGPPGSEAPTRRRVRGGAAGPVSWGATWSRGGEGAHSTRVHRQSRGHFRTRASDPEHAA